MRKVILTLLLTSLTVFTWGQTWFERNVEIGQSMETAETRAEPGQLMFTVPKDSSSWLFNFGATIDLNSGSNFIAKVTGEYHKNTLIEEEQDNHSAGLAYTLKVIRLHSGSQTDLMSVGDLKYVNDRMEKTNSLATNILFTIYRDAGLAINSNNITRGINFFISPMVGLQGQNVFYAAAETSKGDIIRSIFDLNTSFSILRDKTSPMNPLVTLSATLVLRNDFYNTSDLNEGWTTLVKPEFEYILTNKPVQVSLGISFNYGSDPLEGLQKQRFWIFSLNIAK